ncbi:MAG TPA: SRPBCC family protein [Gaiellaceae bacterium]|nr:SRPBCC family protein [Gaiellaceae bacterium]
MRAEAERELRAGRADVWAFLAEPFHLADWWPGISGVVPDRRGFAPGARWQVRGNRWSNPFTGRRPVEQLLVVGEIDQYERWSFHLVAERLDAEVRLRARGPERTLVTVTVEGGWLLGGRGSLARKAVERLHALVQTAPP